MVRRHNRTRQISEELSCDYLSIYDIRRAGEHNRFAANYISSQASFYRSREIAAHKTLAMTIRSVMCNTHTAHGMTISQ